MIVNTGNVNYWFIHRNSINVRIFVAEKFADMAQLVEQRIRNAWVTGSSPVIGS